MKAGALIFDEVKVIGRLLWNSRSQKIIGLSMTREDLATLADVYQELKDESNQQTSYIMQFLWRDLTSDFDIIGPYYTSCTSFKNKFVYSCVIETIKLFHLHELTTLLLVCDGASSNLTMLKATHGHFGVYSISNEGDDPFTVQPVMINPFDPPNLIYWLICPTHQLKNMINALFSSKSEGTKEFIQQEVSFGWKSILDLWERECRRISSGETRMVPKLKEVHIIRDFWTKLNVTPAKIMQQEHVLSELFRHIEEMTATKECCTSDSNTLQFLEACNKIFENGFLSHSRVVSMDSEVLKSIDEGYQFFSNWLKEVQIKKGSSFNYADPNKEFLAWQTVETLFSQYKYNAGGKLDAVNYATARAASLVKQVVSSHHCSKDYKDQPLQTTELPLNRKQYQKKA